jgi:hypothetical protein
MDAGKYDLKINAGADWTITMWCFDDDENIKDLTLYTALLQIRKSVEGPVIKELGTTPKTGITITGAEGKIKIELTNIETTALAVRQGVYDLLLTNTNVSPNLKTRLIEGLVDVEPAVTR